MYFTGLVYGIHQRSSPYCGVSLPRTSEQMVHMAHTGISVCIGSSHSSLHEVQVHVAMDQRPNSADHILPRYRPCHFQSPPFPPITRPCRVPRCLGPRAGHVDYLPNYWVLCARTWWRIGNTLLYRTSVEQVPLCTLWSYLSASDTYTST